MVLGVTRSPDPLSSAWVPAALVPIRLPWIVAVEPLTSIAAPRKYTPGHCLVAEMTLPSPAPVPPMVMCAWFWTSTPMPQLPMRPVPAALRPMVLPLSVRLAVEV